MHRKVVYSTIKSATNEMQQTSESGMYRTKYVLPVSNTIFTLITLHFPRICVQNFQNIKKKKPL